MMLRKIAVPTKAHKEVCLPVSLIRELQAAIDTVQKMSATLFPNGDNADQDPAPVAVEEQSKLPSKETDKVEVLYNSLVAGGDGITPSQILQAEETDFYLSMYPKIVPTLLRYIHAYKNTTTPEIKDAVRAAIRKVVDIAPLESFESLGEMLVSPGKSRFTSQIEGEIIQAWTKKLLVSPHWAAIPSAEVCQALFEIVCISSQNRVFRRNPDEHVAVDTGIAAALFLAAVADVDARYNLARYLKYFAGSLFVKEFKAKGPELLKQFERAPVKSQWLMGSLRSTLIYVSYGDS